MQDLTGPMLMVAPQAAKYCLQTEIGVLLPQSPNYCMKYNTAFTRGAAEVGSLMALAHLFMINRFRMITN